MKNLLKHITRIIVLCLVALYLVAFVLLRIPAVQSALADQVAEALSEKLGTKVLAGNVDVRFPNRLIVDDLLVYDQQQAKMLHVARLSAAVEILPLFDGEIDISSAQLFGMKAKLYKKDAASPINCQFVIDSLSSKDTTNHTPLNLNIASLIIRNGSVTYDQYDKPMKSGRFSPNHLNVSNLSSHIILYKLTDDSLNLEINRMSLDEKSGIHLKNFSANIFRYKQMLKMSELQLAMPGTDIQIPKLKVSYLMEGDTLKPGSLNFDGSIYAKQFDANDFSAFLSPKVISAIPRLQMKAAAAGTDKAMKAKLGIQSFNSKNLVVEASGTATDILGKPAFDLILDKCNISESLISALTTQFALPRQLTRLGSIDVKGRVQASDKSNIEGNLNFLASRVGKAKLNAKYHGNYAKMHLETPALNIAQVVEDKGFGTLTCNIDAEAHTTDGRALTDVKSIGGINGMVKGVINKVTYNDYTYHDINLDAMLKNSTVRGSASIDDPNIAFKADGIVSLGKVKGANATFSLQNFTPSMLHLSSALGKKTLNVTAEANMKGTSLDNMLGTLNVSDFALIDRNDHTKDVRIENFTLSSTRMETGEKEVVLNSDIADVVMRGDITLSQIPRSMTNLVAEHLPSLPGLPSVKLNDNNFSIDATIKDITLIKQFVNLPVTFEENITLKGFVNSHENNTELLLSAPNLTINDNHFHDTQMLIWTSDGDIHSTLTTLLKQTTVDVPFSFEMRGSDNSLYTTLTWDNMRQRIFRGTLNTVTQFYTDLGGKQAVKVNIPHSSFEFGDTLWSVHSQGIEYSGGKLSIDHFAVENENQHLYVDGIGSNSPEDSIVADFKDINVEYVMNLINFHSVDFSGFASGRAVGYDLMGNLNASAHLDVKDFLFEHGHMGTLHADAKYSNATESIDIDAVCDDAEADAKTLINGAISPQKNTIDLDIKAENTRLEFMQSMCGSFLGDVDLRGNGNVRLAGLLNAINLTGALKANGEVTILSTNCRYSMPGDSIFFVPDDILFNECPMYDKYNNVAYLSGGVHHKNLGRISFDLTAETKKFLAYDCPTLNGSTFCGHAIIDGNIGLHGRGNEVNISADCTALKGSYIVYDATSPDAIKSQDFVTWGSMSKENQKDSIEDEVNNSGNDRTNIRMRFMVNATPDAKLHLIMDAISGDYIDLYGAGALRVNYYNKGSMEIFGNYAIDHGTYKMTIQNILRRDFEFQKGGQIAFGGDPYNAVLRMQAAYKLNSVSLADLNIGTSFKANNVPVNCLMNITGTPAKPNVEFNLDLPSLSSDARQMVYSIINSEEEMNQQVLYLLAIGRFYSQQQNNTENSARTGQTSLAMQSFLSGTLSQQLNNILKQAIGSNNWSIGANVTPGADGMSNAEYEGLLSGRLFNNRLIFNGQFGYRNNVTTNSQNFIGDFSLQYLLTPNGNLSIKVYNQANDRYFTRNSLNTQGVGFVIQKEFGK